MYTHKWEGDGFIWGRFIHNFLQIGCNWSEMDSWYHARVLLSQVIHPLKILLSTAPTPLPPPVVLWSQP